MPKRKALSSTPPRNKKSLPDNSNSPDPSDQEADTAANLIAVHKEQQNRRRSRARNPGSRTKTSIWTTLAATQVDGDRTKLQCNICDAVLSSNASVSSSNI